MTEAARTAPATGARHSDDHDHDHNWLRDLILGGQDGLVNVLGITLGVSAASRDVKVLLAAGLAATFAEGVSMGAVAYTSSMAQADHYQGERPRQQRILREDPARAREALSRIYAAKGFRGELLDRIVATLAANEDNALATLMSEGEGLEPSDERSVLRSAVVVGVATIVGSLIRSCRSSSCRASPRSGRPSGSPPRRSSSWARTRRRRRSATGAARASR